MKLRIIWTGRTRNTNLLAVGEDYLGRIRRFLPLEVAEIREPRTQDDKARVLEEGKRILSRVAPTDYVVVLDDSGQSPTSPELATLIESRMSEGQRDLTFVVGGPAGFSRALRDRADLRLSLSRLTFSHDLARTILLEQLYRALTVIRGLPYAR